jgi:hypothetical protein
MSCFLLIANKLALAIITVIFTKYFVQINEYIKLIEIHVHDNPVGRA